MRTQTIKRALWNNNNQYVHTHMRCVECVHKKTDCRVVIKLHTPLVTPCVIQVVVRGTNVNKKVEIPLLTHIPSVFVVDVFVPTSLRTFQVNVTLETSKRVCGSPLSVNVIGAAFCRHKL